MRSCHCISLVEEHKHLWDWPETSSGSWQTFCAVFVSLQRLLHPQIWHQKRLPSSWQPEKLVKFRCDTHITIKNHINMSLPWVAGQLQFRVSSKKPRFWSCKMVGSGTGLWWGCWCWRQISELQLSTCSHQSGAQRVSCQLNALSASWCILESPRRNTGGVPRNENTRWVKYICINIRLKQTAV